MATVNKDFKIKSGLVVEGTTGTINGYDILTESQGSIDFIVSTIGGTATAVNTPNTVVKRNADGDFAAGEITADLVGDVTGQVSDISNHSTSDLTEGTNQYFTDTRAKDAVSAALGDGIEYESGSFNVQIATGLVLGGGTGNEIEIDRTTVDAWYDANGAAAQALTDAQGYADALIDDASNSSVQVWSAYKTATEIGLAEEAAIDHANGLASNYDAAGSASAVQDNLDDHTDATSGVHGVTGNVVGTTDTQTLSNKTLGSDLAAGGYKVSGLADPTADQDSATKAYVDDAISSLVNGAPELLDTLNELAAAIDNDEDFSTSVGTLIGEKVAKSGDSMTGNLDFGGTSKVTSLAAPTSNGDAANKLYVDTEISDLDTAAQGYADDAETNAIAYADALTTTDIAEGTSLYFTNQRALDATNTAYDATGTAQGIVNALDTDDIEEGATNLYFTNQRAIDAVGGTIGDAIDELNTDDIEEGTTNLYFTDSRAKSSAASLLTGASLTNITITGTGAGLTITAENGVADSDTDDLEEGSTNLYFTDERAVDALEAVVPNFTAVEVNSVAKQVAGTTVVPVAGIATAYSWLKADYRSAEFLVKIANGDHTEVSKVLLTLHTNDNISITEYGIVGTNGDLGSVTAAISGNDVQLQVTTANNTSTVTVVGTLLA
jgi:hypothetical protein